MLLAVSLISTLASVASQADALERAPVPEGGVDCEIPFEIIPGPALDTGGLAPAGGAWWLNRSGNIDDDDSARATQAALLNDASQLSLIDASGEVVETEIRWTHEAVAILVPTDAVVGASYLLTHPSQDETLILRVEAGTIAAERPVVDVLEPGDPVRPDDCWAYCNTDELSAPGAPTIRLAVSQGRVVVDAWELIDDRAPDPTVLRLVDSLPVEPSEEPTVLRVGAFQTYEQPVNIVVEVRDPDTLDVIDSAEYALNLVERVPFEDPNAESLVSCDEYYTYDECIDCIYFCGATPGSAPLFGLGALLGFATFAHRRRREMFTDPHADSTA